MKATFLNFMDSLDAAPHETSIRAAILDVANRLGYQRYAYYQGDGVDIRTFSNYPPEWEEHYINSSYSAIDPVVWHGKQMRRAFVWNAENWTDASLPEEIRSFAEHAISHGLRSGLTIPVGGSFGRTLMLTFASRKNNRRLVLPQYTLPLGHAVLAVHYNLLRVADDALISARKALSPQEAVCLQWSARGKRQTEIADLLEISPRTVQGYLDRARDKLDAITVAHAVAIGKEKKIC